MRITNAEHRCSVPTLYPLPEDVQRIEGVLTCPVCGQGWRIDAQNSSQMATRTTANTDQEKLHRWQRDARVRVVGRHA